MAKDMKAQFGCSEGADFAESTWTFLMDSGFVVGAGKYAIVPRETFSDLLETLIEMEREKAEYMTRNNLGDPAKEHTNKKARAAISKALGGEQQ
jgi:hypothetical protein